MARIRNIKPRFWDSPDTAKADLAPRLLFMALWNWADDSGRGTANLKELEAFAFPNDIVAELPRRSRGNSAAVWPSFGHILAEVQKCYGVVFYRVGSRRYFDIPSFKKHQSKNFKPDSSFPGPNEGEIWDLTSEFVDSTQPDTQPEDDACAEMPQPVAGIPRLAAVNHPLDGDRDGDKDLKDLPDPDGSGDGSLIDLDVAAADYPNTFEQIPEPKYPPDFEAWWQHYPRKVGKGAALKAWRKALTRATKDELIAGAIRYADDPNREDQFTKYPEGWLSRDGWLDEPAPGKKAAGGIKW